MTKNTKEMTMAELLKEIEKKAREYETAGTFAGKNAGLASVLMASFSIKTK